MFAVKNMTNVYDIVKAKGSDWSEFQIDKNFDIEKLKYVADEIAKTQGPFFAHVHMMLTHGPQYWPQHRMWSYGKSQNDNFMTDFYDDAILETDGYMQMLIDFLKSTGRFDNTIFIYTSDHGDGWSPDKRLPLVIRFPNAEIRKNINHNTQLIDLPPSILDYMGIEKPDWMEGESLLSIDDSKHRPIFTTGISGTTEASDQTEDMVISDYSAPFYSMGSVLVVIANRVYKLDLKTNRMTVKELEGHTAPQAKSRFPALEEVREMLISHLKSNDYDVSSLVNP